MHVSKSGRHGISMFDFISPLRLRRGSVGRPGWRRGGRGRACCRCLVSEAPCWRPLLVGWATYNIDRKAPGGGPAFIACTYVSRGPSLNLLIYFGGLSKYAHRKPRTCTPQSAAPVLAGQSQSSQGSKGASSSDPPPTTAGGCQAGGHCVLRREVDPVGNTGP